MKKRDKTLREKEKLCQIETKIYSIQIFDTHCVENIVVSLLNLNHIVFP